LVKLYVNKSTVTQEGLTALALKSTVVPSFLYSKLAPLLIYCLLVTLVAIRCGIATFSLSAAFDKQPDSVIAAASNYQEDARTQPPRFRVAFDVNLLAQCFDS
jgi:hypothetical protein